MARTKDTALQERNRRICMYRRNGFTYSAIADLEDVSRVRVAQIVAETNEELGEEDGRAEIASLLEYAERKCVDLIENPGFVCGPTGRVAEDPDGNPLENRGVVADALKTLMTIEDRKAKLFALDKPQKRAQMTSEEASQQAHAFLTAARVRIDLDGAERKELEELRRRLAITIPGQVERPEIEG